MNIGEIIQQMHGNNHEFEKPICLATETPSVQFAYAQLDKHMEEANVTLKKVMEAEVARLNKIADGHIKHLENMIQEAGKMPKDWDKTRDHLLIGNGVIYQARCYAQASEKH